MSGYRLMYMRMWMRGSLFSCVVAWALAAMPAAGVVLGQVDDFQDGTPQDWQGGASPFNVSTGGPDGVGDRYLRISTAGGHLATFNEFQWTGDYIAEDITSVNVHLNNLGPDPLSMRLVLLNLVDTPGQTAFASIATVLPAASGWVSVEFLLDEAEFTQTQGFETFDQVLATVEKVLLRHDPDPVDPPGTPSPVTGTLGIDNITALPEPGMIPVLATGIAALVRLRAGRRSRAAAERSAG